MVISTNEDANSGSELSLPIHRIGVIIADDVNLKKPALEFLILRLNTLQRHFEYELLPSGLPKSPLADLDQATEEIPRKNLRDTLIPQFLVKFESYLRNQSETFGLREEPPQSFIFISLATTQGWVKMQQIVNGVNIHYVMNTITGAVADFKFK